MPSEEKPKRLRRSYNCGACKRNKIKCDTNLPCGNCVKYKRESTCYAEPPNPPTQEQIHRKIRKRQIAEIHHLSRASSVPTSQSSPFPPQKAFKSEDIPPPPVDPSHAIKLALKRFSEPDGHFALKDSAVAVLPPRDQILQLVSLFFEDCNYGTVNMNEHLFRILLQRFFEDVQVAGRPSINIEFLALLYMVVAGALIMCDREWFCQLSGIAEEFNYNNFYAAKFFKSFSFYCLCESNVSMYPTEAQREMCLLHKIDTYSAFKVYGLQCMEKDVMYEQLIRAMASVNALRLECPLTYKDSEPLPFMKIDLVNEDKRLKWWSMCFDDTEIAIMWYRSPLIKSSSSEVPFPLEVNFDGSNKSTPLHPQYTQMTFALTMCRINKTLSAVFDFTSHIERNNEQPWQKTLHLLKGFCNVDKLLCEIGVPKSLYVSNFDPIVFSLPPKLQVVRNFQKFCCISRFTIKRFKLYQSYIYLNHPLINTICLTALQKSIEAYLDLSALYPMESHKPKYRSLLTFVLSLGMTAYQFFVTHLWSLEPTVEKHFLENLRRVFLDLSHLSNCLNPDIPCKSRLDQLCKELEYLFYSYKFQGGDDFGYKLDHLTREELNDPHFSHTPYPVHLKSASSPVFALLEEETVQKGISPWGYIPQQLELDSVLTDVLPILKAQQETPWPNDLLVNPDVSSHFPNLGQDDLDYLSEEKFMSGEKISEEIAVIQRSLGFNINTLGLGARF